MLLLIVSFGIKISKLNREHALLDNGFGNLFNEVLHIDFIFNINGSRFKVSFSVINLNKEILFNLREIEKEMRACLYHWHETDIYFINMHTSKFTINV